jgi:uncharacterized protein YkwD/LysM repeat protein
VKRIWTLISLFILIGWLVQFGRVEAQSGADLFNQSALGVIEEVNSLRGQKKLPLYQVNTILMQIAQRQAEYIASNGVITHFDANGMPAFKRALSAGYMVAGDLAKGGYFSENIHAGLNLSSSEVVGIWQKDSDHLKTLISPDLREVGVGVALGNGLTYYVLDAGTSTDAFSNTPSALTITFTAVPGTPGVRIITSTPLENGAIYHIVQPNEALWSIAQAYNLTIAELKNLNGLSSNQIFVGQKLLIKKRGDSTITPTPTILVTLGIPTSTAKSRSLPTPTLRPTVMPTPPASREASSRIVIGIFVFALLAAGLGLWIGKKKSE